MQLSLSPNCPLFGGQSDRDLARLLELVAKGWHTIVRPQPAELEAMLPAYMWTTFGTYLRNRYRAATTSREAYFAPKNCDTCNATKLVEHLELALQLVVENANTDGQFLRLIASKFEPSIARALRIRRIDIRTAGGIGEIPKEMMRLAAEHSQAVLPTETVPIFAVADSDGDAPGRQSTNAKAVVKAAEQLGCSAHVLMKRAIENYVADDVIREYVQTRADRREAASYILGLPSAIRDFYPMKSGLEESPVNHPVFPDTIALQVGLGDFIADLMGICAHHFDRRSLDERDGVGELSQLVGTLAAQL